MKEFMEANYRPGFKYADFATMFTAKFFDAKKWAKIIAKSNAKYVSVFRISYIVSCLFFIAFCVLHIAGALPVWPYFTGILYSRVSTMTATPNWPSKESWNWNSVDVGPHKDIVGKIKVLLIHNG